MSTDFTLENAADLAVAVLWACATSEEYKFSVGVPSDSVYTSYYSYAYGNAFCKVAEWLLAEYGVTHGYSKHATRTTLDAVPTLAEDILSLMAECGPEPVRSLRTMAQERRLNDEAVDALRKYNDD